VSQLSESVNFLTCCSRKESFRAIVNNTISRLQELDLSGSDAAEISAQEDKILDDADLELESFIVRAFTEPSLSHSK
jgi:hypothetical protein